MINNVRSHCYYYCYYDISFRAPHKPHLTPRPRPASAVLTIHRLVGLDRSADFTPGIRVIIPGEAPDRPVTKVGLQLLLSREAYYHLPGTPHIFTYFDKTCCAKEKNACERRTRYPTLRANGCTTPTTCLAIVVSYVKFQTSAPQPVPRDVKSSNKNNNDSGDSKARNFVYALLTTVRIQSCPSCPSGAEVPDHLPPPTTRKNRADSRSRPLRHHETPRTIDRES